MSFRKHHPLLISRSVFRFPELTRCLRETPQALAPPSCFPPPWIRLLSGPHRCEIIWDSSFSGWIISRSKLSSRFIQVVAYVRRSFLLETEYYSISWAGPRFVYPIIDERCFAFVVTCCCEHGVQIPALCSFVCIHESGSYRNSAQCSEEPLCQFAVMSVTS